MAPQVNATILAGPKKPHWGCPCCGCSSNWASKLVCRRGQKAPQRAQQQARRADKDAKAASPGKGGGGAGLQGATLAPWSKEGKKMDKAFKEARAQLAQATELNFSLEAGDGETKDGTFAQRAVLQEMVNAHEKMLKEHEHFGEVDIEMDKLARAELEKLREEVRSLKPPVMAQTQCLQKLERVKMQVKSAEQEAAPLEQHLETTKQALIQKQEFLEAIEAEAESLKWQQVARNAAKIGGNCDAFKSEVPEDFFPHDPELQECQGEGAEEMRAFVPQLVADARWAKARALLRKQAGRAKRGVEFSFDKAEVETLWSNVHDATAEGINVSKESLMDIVFNVQQPEQRRLSSGGAAKT
ncbi:unnamed protein product, partial [Prorocentrum cordatum]